MSEGAKQVNSFSFFRSYADAARLLDDEERLWLFDSMCAFAFDGVLPEADGNVREQLAWTLIEPNLKKSIENQLNGKKGGRPKKEQKGA